MRQIKFRAWDFFDETMIYSSEESAIFVLENEEWSVKFIREKNMNVDGIEVDAPVWHESDEIELMQFTGLQDKNGKDIYEGDIIKHNTNYFVVCFRANMGMCFVDMGKFEGGKDLVYNKDNWRDWLWVYNVKKYLEIIGNIYETPLSSEANDAESDTTKLPNAQKAG